MPAVHPETRGDIQPSRKLLRSVVGGGLTAAAIAVVVALPDPAAAEPSLKEQLKAVSADLKDAKSDLSGLKDRRGEAKNAADAAQDRLDAAPDAVISAVESVEDADSPIERLSLLSGYGATHTAELAEAVDDRTDATRLVADLSGDIDDADDKVDDLSDKRDKLKDEIAEAAEAAESAETESETEDDSPAVSTDASGAVAFAEDQLGDAYVFGATGPDNWDCSSLTQAAWAAAGKTIGRDTYAQWGGMTHIDRSQLRAGDLVFYNGQGHVAMYVGDGRVIHAPQPGEVVKYSDIDMMPIDGYTRA